MINNRGSASSNAAGDAFRVPFVAITLIAIWCVGSTLSVVIKLIGEVRDSLCIIVTELCTHCTGDMRDSVRRGGLVERSRERRGRGFEIIGIQRFAVGGSAAELGGVG